jgi:hypothetical protein
VTSASYAGWHLKMEGGKESAVRTHANLQYQKQFTDQYYVPRSLSLMNLPRYHSSAVTGFLGQKQLLITLATAACVRLVAPRFSGAGRLFPKIYLSKHFRHPHNPLVIQPERASSNQNQTDSPTNDFSSASFPCIPTNSIQRMR